MMLRCALLTLFVPRLRGDDVVLPHCSYQKCPFCFFPAKAVSNLTILGSDGLSYSVPLRVARADFSWDTGSMLGQILGILVKEILGFDVEYVSCTDTVMCHLAMLNCGGWSDSECTHGPDPAETVKGSKEVLPDIFVAPEMWPASLDYDSMGLDKQTWATRETITIGSTGFTAIDGVCIFAEAESAAWSQSEVVLTNFPAYTSDAALQFLVAPEHFILQGIVPETDGCPGNGVVFETSVQLSMDALAAEGFVCQDSWWLSPACAALNNNNTNNNNSNNNSSNRSSWRNSCIAVLDADWGLTFSELYIAMANSSILVAKVILGYDLFYQILNSGIKNTTFLSWSTDTAFSGQVRVAMRQDVRPERQLISKMAWEPIMSASPKLRILLAQFYARGNVMSSIIAAVIKAKVEGHGPDEIAAPGFYQKVGCDWLRGHAEVWQKWLPNPDTCLTGEAFDAARLVCSPCPEGTAFTRPRGVGTCVNCSAGHYGPSTGTTSCLECPAGFFQPRTGHSACLACPLSTYQDVPGQVDCKPCLGSFTTALRAANSKLDCSCPPGTFLEPLDAACHPCLEGMSCPGREAMPLQQAGYWIEVLDSSAQDFSVFRCRDEQECPAGSAGNCPDGRVGRACNSCKKHYHQHINGQCVECDGTFMVPLIVSAVGSALLAALFTILTKDFSRQHLTYLTVLMTGGQLVTALQTLSAFGQRRDLSYPDSVQLILQIIEVLSFNFVSLKVSCVVEVSPMIRLFMQLVTYPLFAILLLVGFLVSKNNARTVPWEALYNLNGATLFIMFISLSIACVRPLQCVSNPNGKMSMLADPGIVCWESGEHLILTTMSIIGVFVYPISILSMTCWVTWKYPSRVASGRGLRLNLKYHFLFGRFRSERYYFGSIYLLRNLVVALVPVVFADFVGLQLLVLTATVLMACMLQAVSVQPFRPRYQFLAYSPVHRLRRDAAVRRQRLDWPGSCGYNYFHDHWSGCCNIPCYL
ncbi:unnamed protein product [Polarella glacialis]|uniref:Tyrosine-protein kinase ephrin type A/B receptor-like domain-containing protein n=1 Tax=Polarella glacialis TaxID=89957 RepID=A0A813K0T5_POLGL|nr:unnamed protein product [Polarella glacialis]